MSQIRIPFGLDRKTAKFTGSPFASWLNLKLKSSNLWKVAFVEINGKSYGPLLKPTQNHDVVMKVGSDYKAHVYINGQSVIMDNMYIGGDVVVSLNDTSTNINNLVDFIEESFYDH